MNYNTLFSVYQYIIENSTDLILVSPFDTDNQKFIYANKSACTTFDLTKSEIIDKTYSDLFPLITSEKVKKIYDNLSKYNKVILGETINNKFYNIELIYDKHNDVIIYIFKNDTYKYKLKTQLDMRNNELLLLHKNMDKIQQKLNNTIEYYSNFFEHMPVGGIFLDEHGLIININNVACDYFELSKKDLINKLFISNLKQDDRSQFVKFLKCIKDDIPAHYRYEIVTVNENIKTLDTYGCMYGTDICLCLVDISNYSSESFPSIVDYNEFEKEDDICCKLLIVEDEAVNVLVISNIFTKLGCEIDIARDGKDAIDKVKQHEYDMIFMDISMPVLNGVEATKIIRNQLNIKTPIIAVTGFDSKKDIDRFLSAGMNDYIQKPINKNEITRVLKSFIKRN